MRYDQTRSVLAVGIDAAALHMCKTRSIAADSPVDPEIDSARQRANSVRSGSLDTIELADADAGYIPERERPSVLGIALFPHGPHQRMDAAARP